MKLPCIDCLCNPICQLISINSIGFLISKLEARCSIFKSYINLEDLELETPSRFTSIEEREYHYVELRKRIKKLSEFRKINYNAKKHVVR